MRESTKLTWALGTAMGATNFSLSTVQFAFTIVVSMGSESLRLPLVSTIQIVMLLGACVGPLLVWPLSLVLSRQRVMLVAITIGMLSGILVTVATEAALVLAGAGFAGVSNTMVYITATLWQVENAETRDRGRKVILVHVGGMAGYALGTWITFGCLFSGLGGPSLKIILGLPLLLFVVAFIYVFFATDSYRWLLSHNRPDEARAALARMRNQEQSNPSVTAYFDSLVQHRRQLATNSAFCSRCASARKRFSGNQTGILHLHSPRRLGVAVAIQAMTGLTGVYAANQYLYNLLERIFTTSAPVYSFSLMLAALTTLNAPFLLIAYYLLPRLGVRKLLTIGSLCLAASLLITLIVGMATNSNGSVTSFSLLDTGTTVTTAAGSGGSTAPRVVLVTFLVLSFVFFGLSWASLPWLLASEIGSSLGYHNEGTAIVCIATVVRAAIEVGSPFAAATGIADIGFLLLVVWLVLDVAFAALVWLFCPETVGRSLEDVDIYFARAPSKLVFKDQDAKGVKKLDGRASAAVTGAELYEQRWSGFGGGGGGQARPLPPSRYDTGFEWVQPQDSWKWNR